jgi:phospholipase A1
LPSDYCHAWFFCEATTEWLTKLGDSSSNLRLHTQLFHGYGDMLIDYNRKRTVLSLGVSLLDF